MSVFKNKGNNRSQQPEKSATSGSKAVSMGDQSKETLANASKDKSSKDKTSKDKTSKDTTAKDTAKPAKS